MSGHRKSNATNVIIDAGKDLTIGEAAGLRERIIRELQSSDFVTLHLTDIEVIDLAGLQILCSSNRSFEKHRKTLTIQAGNKFGFLKSFMISAGYNPSGCCPEGTCTRCLWKGDTHEHG